MAKPKSKPVRSVYDRHNHQRGLQKSEAELEFEVHGNYYNQGPDEFAPKEYSKLGHTVVRLLKFRVTRGCVFVDVWLIDRGPSAERVAGDEVVWRMGSADRVRDRHSLQINDSRLLQVFLWNVHRIPQGAGSELLWEIVKQQNLLPARITKQIPELFGG